jgi:hypothetical protein
LAEKWSQNGRRVSKKPLTPIFGRFLGFWPVFGVLAGFWGQKEPFSRPDPHACEYGGGGDFEDIFVGFQ